VLRKAPAGTPQRPGPAQSSQKQPRPTNVPVHRRELFQQAPRAVSCSWVGTSVARGAASVAVILSEAKNLSIPLHPATHLRQPTSGETPQAKLRGALRKRAVSPRTTTTAQRHTSPATTRYQCPDFQAPCSYSRCGDTDTPLERSGCRSGYPIFPSIGKAPPRRQSQTCS